MGVEAERLLAEPASDDEVVSLSGDIVPDAREGEAGSEIEQLPRCRALDERSLRVGLASQQQGRPQGLLGEIGPDEGPYSEVEDRHDRRHQQYPAAKAAVSIPASQAKRRFLWARDWPPPRRPATGRRAP